MTRLRGSWILAPLALAACVPAKDPAKEAPEEDTAVDSAVDSAPPDDSGDSGDTATPPDPGAADADGDGTPARDDCDDLDPDVHPGAPEDCDGVDDDCDGAVDEDGQTRTRPAGWAAPAYVRSDGLDYPLIFDADGDGALDLVGCYSEIRTLLNPGGDWIADGALVSPFPSTLLGRGRYCDDRAALDVDEDGDTDLVTVLTDASLEWWANDGAGGFAAGGTLARGVTGTGHVQVGDWDADGRLDLHAAPWIYWNEGGGVFTAAAPPCPDTEVHAADVRADGGAVLLCSNPAEGWVADADRAWSRVSVAGGCAGDTPDRGPASGADLDGDGFLDTVVGSRVCYGDGTGALTFGEELLPDSDYNRGSTTFSDADGDGWADLAMFAQLGEAGDVLLFRGGPTGLTLDAAVRVPWHYVSGDTGALMYGDVDADGAVELLVADGSGLVQFEDPDGDGGLDAPWADDPESNSNLAGTAADLDGDGAPEVIALSYDDAYVYWNDGSGGLAEPEAHPHGLDAGGRIDAAPFPLDLDGDGAEEILVTYPSWTVLDWDGSAVRSTAVPVPDPYFDSTFEYAADLDGDGDDELIVENAAHVQPDTSWSYGDEEHVRVGGLAAPGFPADWIDLVDTFGTDTMLAFATGADLDGDGRADVAVVTAGGVSVWGWDGASFGERAASSVAWSDAATDPGARRWLAAVDADHDGDTDLVLALQGEAAAQVLRNDGAGGFTIGARVAVDAELADDSEVRVDDLDRDGWPELWSLNDGTGSLWRWEGDGFGAGGPLALNLDGGVTARDLDGDDAPELIGAYRSRLFVYGARTEDVVYTCE